MRATSLLAAVLALGCLGVAGAGPAAHAGDWPQILGPKRD
jgi:hypothetical protein